MKPIIGVTTDLVEPKNGGQPRAVLDTGYTDGILAAGGTPVAIPPYPREEVLEEYLDRVDGVLLTGGHDLNPRKLGKKPHPSIRPMLERREASDRILGKMLVERKVPTLCVGVSMQLMNVLMGGEIYLHLPEDMPRGMPHYDAVDGTHRHIVFITPSTRLEAIYGEGEIRVNSSHHQGIKRMGRAMRSGALAPDGLIEAIESFDPSWWMVGVQWHPESSSSSALDRQLFEGFVEACSDAAAGSQPTTFRLAG